jgi:hypothetical protein
VLLALVAGGRVRAVEGAASAGVALLLWGAFSRQLTRQRLGEVLSDAMVITGVLFALRCWPPPPFVAVAIARHRSPGRRRMVAFGGGPRQAVLLVPRRAAVVCLRARRLS